MTISIGEKVPAATVMTMGPDGPESIEASELFANKQVVVFGLPGAYTPVCSAEHLPGFVKRAADLSDRGCDAIACVSVNDPFVLDAWGREHGADGIMMLADNKAELTRALGLQENFDAFGLGERSKRYSMIVEDGVVTSLNVEDSVLDHGVSSCSMLISQL